MDMKIFPYKKGSIISIATSPTNNYIFLIGIINSTDKMLDIHSGICFHTHYGHVYDINLVLFFTDVNVFGAG